MYNFKRPTEAEICGTFDERYSELIEEGGSHKIQGLFRDKLGFLLMDVCALLPHAPHPGSIVMIDSAFTSRLDEIPAIVYTFHYNPNSIGENALLFLVRTKERKIRLFAVETHGGQFYLCEYRDFSHLNYGIVDPEKLADKVAEKLMENKYNKNSFEMEDVMSDTGNWGDKIIITLHSDGERRHKKWCDNYDDNFCRVRCEKCIGSAHCEYYKNKYADNSHVFYRKKVGEGGTGKMPGINRLSEIGAWRERYRAASYGDKLLHEIVFVRNTPHTFRICEVKNEDFYYFIVEYDGREHKYEKRTAYRRHSVYIFCGLEFDGNEEQV